jgi:hypothetical protein
VCLAVGCKGENGSWRVEEREIPGIAAERRDLDAFDAQGQAAGLPTRASEIH